MKFLEIVCKTIGCIIAAIILLVSVNFIFRVSDYNGSHGYIEELLFSGPIKGKLDKWFRSENFILYNDVNKSVFFVHDIIRQYGSNLVYAEHLEKQRVKAINALNSSIINITKISDIWLFESNPQLPIMYRNHFQESLLALKYAFVNKDKIKFHHGLKEYNKFLSWIQSKNRDDFENLK